MTEPIATRFAQTARREAIDRLFEGRWITLYRLVGEEAWYSGLIAADKVPSALADIQWDLHWGNLSGPSVVHYGSGHDARIRYERFPDEGIEPLVITRERGSPGFHVELAEDLRLYLDLFPGADGTLVQANASGDDDVVARVTAEEVQILKQPLLAYLQARQMHLAIFFDHVVTLEDTGKSPLPEAERYVDVREPDRTWSFGSMDDYGPPISRLCGKRLLAPPPRATKLDKGEGRHADFIIGEDAMGNPVEYSSDPAGLANLFGKNPGAPNYLTPVHFRREVLDRYFHNPARYAVSDGVVRRDPHWVLRIDDDHNERVIVFLGDLGRDIPYTEQLHWRAHNVQPEGGLSKTARARSFEATFADSEQPEHRFKFAYERFVESWTAKHGWPLFRPLPPGDRHLLVKLHVPTSDNPAELDAQLLGLTKILVDSLNDAALDAVLVDPIDGERSLAKLERYLTREGYPHVLRDVATLRALQGLRSTGAAHVRGSNYDKLMRRVGLDGQGAPAIVADLLNRTTEMLDELAATCLPASPGEQNF